MGSGGVVEGGRRGQKVVTGPKRGRRSRWGLNGEEGDRKG